MQGRAILFTGVGEVGLGEFEIPNLEPGEVLIEVHASAISPGTEMRSLAGLQPNSELFPFIPGYAAAGKVVATTEGTEEWTGKSVFTSGTQRTTLTRMWGGHVSHAVVKPGRTLQAFDEKVPFEHAALAKMAGIAHRGLVMASHHGADDLKGAKVAIIGLGLIGQLSARWFHRAGADVLALDLTASRRELVAKIGAGVIAPTGTVSETVRSIWELGADIVVDCTGAPGVLPESIRAMRQDPWPEWGAGPKLVIQGSYPENVVFNYQEAFLHESTLLMPRDCAASDVRTSLDAMADGSFDVSGLVTEVVAPERGQETYNRLRSPSQGGDPNALTFAFNWRA